MSARRGHCIHEHSGSDQSYVMTDAAGQKREMHFYSVCPVGQPQATAMAKTKTRGQARACRRRIFQMFRSSS